MTAQIPDQLDYDGKTYWVYEFIRLPPGVARPPDEALVQSTACWQGYTVRWAIEVQDGRPMLVMQGFECDEYLPLCEPYLQPISGTVRVVPKDAELLHYEHMGFESKYKGELNFRFVAGELVGIEPIPDTQQPQDGLLDLAELGPGGKEGWIDQIHEEQQRQEAAQSTVRDAPCHACGGTIASVREDVPKPLCSNCRNRLAAIGRLLRHWKSDAGGTTHNVMLSDRVDGYGSALVSPQWQARSALLGVGWLSWVDGGRSVRLSVSGYRNVPIRTHLEWATGSGDSVRLEEEAKRLLDAGLAARVMEFPGVEVEVHFGMGSRPVSVIIMRDFTVETEVPGDGVDSRRIAAELERSLDEAVAAWRREVAQVLRRLRKWVPDLIDEITLGTGIYPYRPGELTPIDQSIFARRYREQLRDRSRRWAVLPRHTRQGWVPGETVEERYRKSLNL